MADAGGGDRGPVADGRPGRLRDAIGRLPHPPIRRRCPGGPGGAHEGPGGRRWAPARAVLPRSARTTESPRRFPRPPAQVAGLHRRDSIRLGLPHEATTIASGFPRLSLTSLLVPTLVPTEMVPHRDQPSSFQAHEKDLRSAAIGVLRLCQAADTCGSNSSATAHGLAPREASLAES